MVCRLIFLFFFYHRFNINIRTRRRKGKVFHPFSQEIVDNYENFFPSYSFIQLFHIFRILLKNHLNYSVFTFIRIRYRGEIQSTFVYMTEFLLSILNSDQTLLLPWFFFKVLAFFYWFLPEMYMFWKPRPCCRLAHSVELEAVILGAFIKAERDKEKPVHWEQDIRIQFQPQVLICEMGVL